MPAKVVGDARMDFRLPAETKALIEQAAALTGQNLSDFATSTLTRQAREVIEQHRVIRMSQADYDAFVAFLDEPARPIPALTEAFEEMRRRRGSRHEATGKSSENEA